MTATKDREDPERARGLVAKTLVGLVTTPGALPPPGEGARAGGVAVAMALVIPALLARAAGELEHHIMPSGGVSSASARFGTSGDDDDDEEEEEDQSFTARRRLTAAAAERKERERERLALFRETGARLLELAAADQTAFRAVVAGLNERQRAFAEEIIRVGRGGGVDGGAGGAAGSGAGEDGRPGSVGQPSIALKMDFGSSR